MRVIIFLPELSLQHQYHTDVQSFFKLPAGSTATRWLRRCFSVNPNNAPYDHKHRCNEGREKAGKNPLRPPAEGGHLDGLKAQDV
jgi:hypothetical protein